MLPVLRLMPLLMVVLLAGCAVLPPVAPLPPDGTGPLTAPADSIIIRHVTVPDLRGGPALLDAAVALQGGRIWAVRPNDLLGAPGPATVITLRGATLLPGIVNAAVRGADQSLTRRLFALDGVTAVCDVGAPAEAWSGYDTTRIRVGPIARVAWSGPVLSAGDIEGANRALDAGARMLQIRAAGSPSPGLGELQTLAAANGATLRVQTDGAESMTALPAAGWNTLDGLPAGASPQHVERLAASGGLLIPRLQQGGVACPGADGACRFALLANLRGWPADQLALGNGYGSDASINMGMPLAEMELWLAAGFSPAQVLYAATAGSARACGLANQTGALQAGLAADLLVVDGDPLADLTALRRPLLIMVGGEVVLARDRGEP